MTERVKGRLLDAIWIALCIAASSAWCISASANLGATFDEPTYIALGLESWQTGSSKRLLDLGTMPLPPHVQTLPLHLGERLLGERFDPVRDLESALTVARIANLPFWWLLLFYGWLTGRQIAGPWGGRLAIALLACEPNLLAHASLATTDIAVSACLLALLYHFRIGRDGPWWCRVGIPASWFALAVLTKASGLVFGIIGLTVVELEHRLTTRTELSPGLSRWRAALKSLMSKPFRRDLGQVVLLGLIGAFVYCGSDWSVSPSFVAWAQQLPEGPARSAMVWFAEHLRIFSNAGVALARQVRHNIQGHGVFVLDQVGRRALWYYFPLALSIKSPLPILALPMVLAVIRPGTLWNWASMTALALLLFSLICRVQTGIRLVLPLLVLVVIGCAAGLVLARRQLARGGLRSGVLKACCLGSVAWLLCASLLVWPHGLCYTNELWGGTDNGYRCLSDSNYDWGQGLKELARWQAEHKVHDLDVLYYGTDTALSRLPMRRLAVGALQLGPDNLPQSIQGRTLAVGTSILYGSVSENYDDLRAFSSCLRNLKPVDRTATFLIYRFPSEDELATASKEKGMPERGAP
jgi:hypothetical protein